MAHLVCQYIEFSNGGGSHRHIIGKRTDRASIGSSHASDNEDGNWKCERNWNQIPPGKMLGEESARFPKFAGESAASAADIEGRARRLFFNDLDIRFSVWNHLDVEPVLVGLREEVN